MSIIFWRLRVDICHLVIMNSLCFWCWRFGFVHNNALLRLLSQQNMNKLPCGAIERRAQDLRPVSWKWQTSHTLSVCPFKSTQTLTCSYSPHLQRSKCTNFQALLHAVVTAFATMKDHSWSQIIHASMWVHAELAYLDLSILRSRGNHFRILTETDAEHSIIMHHEGILHEATIHQYRIYVREHIAYSSRQISMLENSWRLTLSLKIYIFKKWN